MKNPQFSVLNKRVQKYILESTTAAGSGHPTSSLSAAELMTSLFFDGFFKYDHTNPSYKNNDRLIFSKGHASPLFYSLWTVAGCISKEELLTMRQFESRLEGHPTLRFPYTEAPTGSLGQGLSIGLGMALNAKYLDKLPYKTFVLLGDGEMAEGSNWEALQLASQYKLGNLIGIIDVSRLEQNGETSFTKENSDHGAQDLEKKCSAFGWNTIVINGHNHDEIFNAYTQAIDSSKKPTMIIAITNKGNGISFLENKDNWHGKALSENELKEALVELGPVDETVKGDLSLPEKIKKENKPLVNTNTIVFEPFKDTEKIATRKIYGKTIAKLHKHNHNIIALDAGMGNSTYAREFFESYPDHSFEMHIAEQNAIGTATGLSIRNKIPFISTFASFITRSYDQLRMAAYSNANVKVVCSHGGVSIGEDGASQMGLEDISMMRSLFNSVVLYPSDAVSAQMLIQEMATHIGLAYIRTTRMDTPILYANTESFPIGGSKTLHETINDDYTLIGAGVTLHEALKAYSILKNEGINCRVIDLYSIKPIDTKTLIKATRETKGIIVIEDHYKAGGIAEAVLSALNTEPTPIHSLAVQKLPRSGKPEELLEHEEINSASIVSLIKKLYTESTY